VKRLLTALLFAAACSGGSQTPPPNPPPSGSAVTPTPVETGSGSGYTDPPPTPTPTPTPNPTPTQGGGSGAALHAKCGAGDACAQGECVTYYGIAGPRGPQFKTCEIKCDKGKACPSGMTCSTVADGPGQVCH